MYTSLPERRKAREHFDQDTLFTDQTGIQDSERGSMNLNHYTAMFTVLRRLEASEIHQI
jgi:hypothetical protein